MDRSNHYETAFEAYLRDRRLAYVAVDEAKRSTLEDEPVKSIDFIVHAAGGAKLLVDVKGRRFLRGTWQNWVAKDDVDGLERWQERFGPDYTPLLVFAYWLPENVDFRRGASDVWPYHGRRYLMRAVTVEDYRRHLRVRSVKWGTVHLPTAAFRACVRPFRHFTHPQEAAC